MRYNRRTAVITPATTYPVDLCALKEYLKITTDDEDYTLNLYLASATDAIQKYCGRLFVNQTVAYHMDGFSESNDREPLAAGYFVGHKRTFLGQNDEFDLPYAPIVSITSIKTYDESNTEATLATAAYRLDAAGGRVYLNDGYTWPTSLRTRDAVLVTYVAGYGEDPDATPAAVRQAILMHAGMLYECRGVCQLSDACKSLLDGYRTLDMFGFV